MIQIDFVTKSKKEYKKEYKEYNLEYKEYTEYTEYTKKFVLAKKKKCTLLYSKEYNLVTLDTIAIVFDISNEKHPFFHLNGVNGSIDLEACGIGVEDVIFLYLILNAIIRTIFIE